MILLVVYEMFGQTYRGVVTWIFITVSMCFMVGMWLYARFLFNACGWEWHKIVDGWTDQKQISNHEVIGEVPEKRWESCADREQEPAVAMSDMKFCREW